MESSPRVVSQSSKSQRSNSSSTITNNNNNLNVPITRSDPNNPYPTTFVQADTSSFKQVVQMLTGSPETVTRRQDPTRNSSNIIPPVKPGPIRKDQYRSVSKLYERRNSLKNFKISPLGHPRPGFYSGWTRTGSSEVALSPSLLEFPSLVLSPVTPLIPDPFNRVASASDDADTEEKKAINEKGFYLHPSPRDSELPPRLLTLFPLTSPKAGEGSPSEEHENRAANS